MESKACSFDPWIGFFNREVPASGLVASVGCKAKAGSTPENNLSKFNQKYGQLTREWNYNPSFRECISVLRPMKKEGAKMLSGVGDGWGKAFRSFEPIQILLKACCSQNSRLFMEFRLIHGILKQAFNPENVSEGLKNSH
jgi:hypothetical protein